MRTPRTSSADGTEPPVGPPVRGRRAHAGPPAADEGPTDPTAEPRHPPGTRARRRRIRPRTVRARIVCLLMVPVVSLLTLWAYATVTTAQDIARLRQVQRVEAEVRAPVGEAVAALQAERRAAVHRVTDPSAVPDDDYRELTARTDRAVAELRLGDRHTVADSGELPTGVARRLEAFVTGAEGLGPLRTAVLAGDADWKEAYGRYTAAIAAAFPVGGALSGVQDADRGSEARVLVEFARAGEALAQEDALLAGVPRADGLAGERLRLFTGAVDRRRTLTESAVADLRGSERAAWRDLAADGAHATVRAAEDDVLAPDSGGPAPGSAAPVTRWDEAHARVRDGMRAIELDAGRHVADRADPFTRGVLTPAGAAVLLGLLAVAASLVISVRIGRGLVVELVGLRDGALEIARRRLPEAMRRLRAGEEVDVDAEAPQGPPAEDEAGQVAEALDTVHRAALRAAAERAELAGGISGVFVNLARRSQILVHRQLSLLDRMERRSDDPNELSDLFRLDHLTTRMRRHAESLIILSGAAPGRAWRMPVSLTDVVRAAVSEVEDYARVEVRHLPEASVVGAAVADLTHLIAELIENAAQFSPPHTRVRVTGEPVGNGYVVEVEDRGLGMGRETLAEANRRIARSEALDLFDSDRLGLFVVSRLAARHDIKVHLKTSPYGGTTAVVLLPTGLLDDGTPGRPSGAAPLASPPEFAGYGSVPAPVGHPEPVPVPAGRPALAASAPAAGEDPSPPRPRGASPLRLHRPHDPPAPADDPGPPPTTGRATDPGPSHPRGRPTGIGPSPLAARPADEGLSPFTGRRADDGPSPLAGGPADDGSSPFTGRRADDGPSPFTARPADERPSPSAARPADDGPFLLPNRPTDDRPSLLTDRPTDPGPSLTECLPAEHGGAYTTARSDDLPRRVRQASLAPQLRDARAADPEPPPAPPGRDERTPELVRERMAAYRDGWSRGGGRPPGRRPPQDARADDHGAEGDPA
ncbi:MULTISPECIES: sensor histidine kinase [Streptomyces]|uniref:sensor histidine kinase n=1 Tax=Streptomyces TaxID=1883 RepID=UPI0010CD1107|nr:ATP-binding protein [Streptomyces sp. SGAir0924]QCR51339.1 ATPase [Streptomyces sp. SGAir0924]